MTKTVIVGASLAGLRTAEALRKRGDDGEIVVVGAETHAPYDRPPLSKKALTSPDEDLVAMTALPVPPDLGVEWVLGTEATGLSLDDRRLTLAGGEDLDFDRLVIATGAHARTLPGTDGVARVHVLRTLEDAISLRASLSNASSVAVVGAGFIGLEVASSCRQLGLPVTVVEALPVPLDRSVGALLGARIAEWHRGAGTTVETGVGVTSLLGRDSVEGLALSDGRVVQADVVVVGIGVAPSTAWLEGSGVDVSNGVSCDSRLRVLRGGRPIDGVVAAGDVARWIWPAAGGPTRLEHWTNAIEQAEAAAQTLLDPDGADFDPIPYFWSDQLGMKLQMLGHAQPGDEVVMSEEDPQAGRWLATYGRDGRVVAALGAGRPAKVMASRNQIATGAPFPPPSAT